MGCSLGPIGSPQQRTTRFRNYVKREQAERMELQIRREKETDPQTLPDQDRGLFAGTLESLLSRDFE